MKTQLTSKQQTKIATVLAKIYYDCKIEDFKVDQNTNKTGAAIVKTLFATFAVRLTAKTKNPLIWNGEVQLFDSRFDSYDFN